MTNIPNLSFEFFPPKNPEQAERLQATRQQLEAFQPGYYSVTFGAGGSTRQGTLNTILSLKRNGPTPVAPHISCMGFDRGEIDELVRTYRSLGITRLVALRGDMMSGYGTLGELAYASELVAHIRETTADHFRIEVACYPEMHPEARNPSSDLAHFKEKVEAGADGAITQYFFNADAYFRFVDRCRKAGIEIPIVPGIMPITNYAQLKRFSQLCGAEIPRWLEYRMQELSDDKHALAELGADFIADMCQRLLAGGAPGLHIYTLNRPQATLAICANLGLG